MVYSHGTAARPHAMNHHHHHHHHHEMGLGPHGAPLHHHNPGGRSCAGCGHRIMDRFLLHALDRYWHHACLKCSDCHATLADIGSSCFTRGGMILCRNDYIKLFGTTGACSGCGQGIPASEFVMRAQAQVYHMKCFTCVKCHSKLMPGDRCSLVNGALLCEQDCIKLYKGPQTQAVRKNAAAGKMRLGPSAAIKV